MSREIPFLAILALMVLPIRADQMNFQPSDIPDDKKVILFKSQFGLVNFFHELHATTRAKECKTCHHMLKQENVIRPCHECHLAEGVIPPAQQKPVPPSVAKAFHTRCKGCHQYTVQMLYKKAGPVTCALCHLGKEHLTHPETHPR